MKAREHLGLKMVDTSSGIVRAPLRWAGSKRKSLDVLRRLMPSKIEHYVEPFAGSACLAFMVQPENLVLGDINPQLIEFYTELREAPDELYDCYSRIPRNSETYYRVRAEYNISKPSSRRAALFLYLNRHCFNGIYRVNTAGHFNVPWGGDRVGQPLALEELIRASKVLRRGSFKCADFQELIEAEVKAGTFVYLDPPYASNETRVFREYHQDSFASDDWNRLIRGLQLIDKMGGYFLLSYAGSNLLTKELGSWNAGYLDVTRNVGGFKSSRRKYREFLATNYKLFKT